MTQADAAADTAANVQQPPKCKPRGTPWPAGTSGNPHGRLSRSVRIAATVAGLTAELGGGPLTDSQQRCVQRLAQLNEDARSARGIELATICNAEARLRAELGLVVKAVAPAAPQADSGSGLVAMVRRREAARATAP